MQIFFPNRSGLGDPLEILGLGRIWLADLVSVEIDPFPLRGRHRDQKQKALVAGIDFVLIVANRHDEVAKAGLQRIDRAALVVEKPRGRHCEPQEGQPRDLHVRLACGQESAEIGVEGDDFLGGEAHRMCLVFEAMPTEPVGG
jgi:hypothetical protein